MKRPSLSIKQKRTFALAAFAVLALLGIGGVLAFTVGMAPANNVLTFGSVKVRVCEYVLDSAGNVAPFASNAQGEYPDTEVKSGQTSRIVKIQNAGQEPEYVRVRLSVAAVAKDGRSYDASQNVQLNVNVGNGSPWVDGGDGWYYYRGANGNGGVLESGAQTESLLDSLTFTGDYYAAARGGSFRLNVDAQAVQAKNQQHDDAPLDVLDVAGWPEAN